MHTAVLRKKLGIVLKAFPLGCCEIICQLLLSDALVNKAIDESCIEVITGPNGAYRFDFPHGIVQLPFACEDGHRIGSTCANEQLAARGNDEMIDAVGIGGSKHCAKIATTGPHDIGMAHCVGDGSHQPRQHSGMGRPQIDIVIYDDTLLAGFVQDKLHTLPVTFLSSSERGERESVKKVRKTISCINRY